MTVPDLHLQGRQDGVELPTQSWTTSSGVRVEINERAVDVRWPAAPDDSRDSWEAMEHEVEDRVAIEMLEVGAPLSVRWLSRRIEVAAPAGSGVATATASVQASGWVSSRRTGSLVVHTHRAGKLRHHPELSRSSEELERAMEVWEGEAVESLGRLYRAVETLVRASEGSSGRTAWGSFGAKTGYGRDEALQLFDSLQSGRHVYVSDAMARLKKLGRPALQPSECLNAVRRLIDVAIATAT